MAVIQWARLQGDLNYQLRRGAWYRVAGFAPGEVLLDVNRRQVPVPRASLKIVSTAPRVWSIVPLPRDAKGLAPQWGDKYAVCPECRQRARLKGSPETMRCPRCERVFRVEWEQFSGEAGPAR
jgi:hypothetical protein